MLETMGGLGRERMIAIFADDAGFVISEEVIADGLEGRIHVSPRILFGRALSLDARRMLIAHNHPSGSAEPSASDISQTREIISQAERLGVMLIDHLVVGRGQVVSMRGRGLI
nr:JAB domain-containing protein [Qipengyuania qiaonensis]